MMKNSRHLNTSTQTAGSLLPEMPRIHHLARRAWIPDTDFRNTAGKYHCVQIHGGERCFLFPIWVIGGTPFPPPSYTSLVTVTSELFSADLNRSRSLSPPPFGRAATQQGLGNSQQSTEHCDILSLRRPIGNPTQLTSFLRHWKRPSPCVAICLSTRKVHQQELYLMTYG